MATYSTLADARQAYLDNADYADVGSSAKARAFIVACRSLLILQPSRSMATSHQVEFMPQLISAQLQEAKDWLAINDPAAAGKGGGHKRYFDISGMRD